ncbi:MAG: hypothetical protein MRY79_00240 [Alphaproteobacteria bacterium]|nr:hypothetical protein [Alphaproteobacteria bacterium]
MENKNTVDLIVSGRVSYIFHLNSRLSYVGLKDVSYACGQNLNNSVYEEPQDGHFIPREEFSKHNVSLGKDIKIQIGWYGTVNDFLQKKAEVCHQKVLECK